MIDTTHSMSKWDSYYMDIAKAVSAKSKDPSTKVGAVIVRKDNTIASTGYNGFPRKLEDRDDWLQDRDTKLGYTIHAEMNAILFAREDLSGCTLYATMFPCSNCALHITQTGIDKVVTQIPDDEFTERWKDSIIRTHKIFAKAGIELIYVSK